jgi:hypothetical protein
MGFDSPALRSDASILTDESRHGTLILRVSIGAVTDGSAGESAAWRAFLFLMGCLRSSNAPKH